MRNIRFEFTCSRPVPLYAYLCNQYLQLNTLAIKIGINKLTYFIEAKGDLEALSELADNIAQDFLLSVWLIDPKILQIDSQMGSRKQLKDAKIEQEFCQQCVPRFGDNQSAQFGDISLHCECCQGSTRLQTTHIDLSYSNISALIETLMSQGSIALPGSPNIILNLNTAFESGREHLLICNPNNLNAQFHLQQHDVLALSSIEKPWIMARPINDHPKLTAPLYNLRFAHNRLLVILCEKLRQKGIDWVYYSSEEDLLPLVWIQSAWSQIRAPFQTGKIKIPLNDIPDPLHDTASINGVTAKWQAAGITCSEEPNLHIEPINNSVNRSALDQQANGSAINRLDAATCALHAGMLEHKQDRNSAVLYFSQYNSSYIQSIDNKKNIELFFAVPELPSTGYDIYYHLEQSPQKKVVEKFRHKYPQDYLRLLDIHFSSPTDNLQTLWAIAAVILGLPSKSLTKIALSDALISAAMAHRGSNSPRIDYPLTKGEAHRGLNWCKTLGTLISFRLADDNDNPKLAFGMHDSLADFIANWIEHLDQNIGIKSVILAGDEFANPVLSQRLSLRLSNNFPLKVNRLLDIDGNNLAIGGLYLKKRRRLTA